MSRVILLCSRVLGALIPGCPFPEPASQLQWPLWPRVLSSFSCETTLERGGKVTGKVVKGLATGFSGIGSCLPWLWECLGPWCAQAWRPRPGSHRDPPQGDFKSGRARSTVCLSQRPCCPSVFVCVEIRQNLS